MAEQPDTLLTQREREVLALVARGLTNQEIAEDLFTSTSTVKLCLHHACIKLGARNRAQAVIKALRQGALHSEDVYSLNELVDLLASWGPEAIETVAKLLKQKIQQDEAFSSVQ
jgi:DNA-binding CsgD family transcriptional regulator